MKKPFRLGIIGLSAERGWAAIAHLPALRALGDVFELVGVANTTLDSAKGAAAAYGVPRAFESVAALVASPDIDVVVVTVKVPYHREVVTAALQAGKSVYCEWPLGNGLEETAALAWLANEENALAVVGTQALASPEVQFIRKLVADGQIGDVLSSTYISAGVSWGDEILKGDTYAMDDRNGATLLSVIGGHALAAIQAVLGPVERIDAVLSQRRQTVRTIESGEPVQMKTPDHVMANAVLQSGAPLSFELRGGVPRGTKFLWEIYGTEADLRVTATNDFVPVVNISPLRVELGRKGQDGYEELEIPMPASSVSAEAVAARNVAGIYRLMGDDLRNGTRSAPSFDHARALHEVLHAIGRSSETGQRVRVR
ncbi:gfo/Idh/MocA family oxidoreductase [Paraburkholderia sp. CNPSo 3155]|uniref:Putative dehydrogenase n=1 Tax=Paraburkholderia atlantica TaxID=2654982 RepID=A0A6I1PUI6_PARAM|nr:Gfo/Idh/MocA family oxidoreductase [Paraburkholderia atlantica]MBB5423131.1 putative dehydrogenase [Paraburkholderia atlantica]MPW08646.1 gfo/Idh/MocA family oxidoreductase [Paraburkholderia atlantica]